MFEIDIEKLPSFLIGKERGIEKARQEIWDASVKEGEKRMAEVIAKRLLNAGMEVEQVAYLTELDRLEIEKLTLE